MRPRPPKGPRRSEARRPLARHHLLLLWRRKRSLSRSLSSTHSTLFLPLLLSLLLAFVPHSPCAMCALSSAGPLAATAASHTGGRSDGRCHRAAPSAAPWTHLPSSVDRRPTLGPSVLSRRPLCLSLSFPRWVSRLRPDRFPSLALASALPCMPPALMYPTAAATSALLLLRRLLSSSCSLSPLLK